MKKWLLASLILAGLLMTGCRSAGEEPTQETTESKAIFTGILSEDPVTNAETKNVLLFLEQIEVIQDPEEIVPTFEEFGVGLTIEKSATDQEWTKGRKVEVTVIGRPITTASIPPQIAGNSIEQVILLP